MDTSQFGGDLENRRQLVETSTSAFEAVGDCKRPVVAAVNGPALAGGFALSLLCDLRVAHVSAVFGYPELPRGIPPSYASARAVLPATVAQELCLTGRVARRPTRRCGSASSARWSKATSWRGLASLRRRSPALPRQAVLETKRRTLLERKHLWGFLFEDEREVFRRALLGVDDPDAAASILDGRASSVAFERRVLEERRARRFAGGSARRASPTPPRPPASASRRQPWQTSPRGDSPTRPVGSRSSTPRAAGRPRSTRPVREERL